MVGGAGFSGRLVEVRVLMLQPRVHRAHEVQQMAHRSGSRLVRGSELTIGARVLVRRKAEADVTGEVVEDFAVLTESGGTGYEWAPAHRWAVAGQRGLRTAVMVHHHREPGKSGETTQNGCTGE